MEDDIGIWELLLDSHDDSEDSSEYYSEEETDRESE